jgi:hypothetical protein
MQREELSGFYGPHVLKYKQGSVEEATRAFSFHCLKVRNEFGNTRLNSIQSHSLDADLSKSVSSGKIPTSGYTALLGWWSSFSDRPAKCLARDF